MTSQKPILLLIILTLCMSCKDANLSTAQTVVKSTVEVHQEKDIKVETPSLLDTTIQLRIETPANYSRTTEDHTSYQAYLRNLKLKPDGAEVKYHHGGIKPNNNVYTAVIDLPIGAEDLHQCADAVMRLRAEYLWSTGQYDEIHFNFTNGHRVDYKEWMNGKRMKIKGNKTWWEQEAEPSNTYNDFWNYLELIFMYAGTASLEKELKTVDVTDAQIGDVLIKGGFPGHAVVIVDKAIHNETGEPIYLLAQSYMPAQETHILINPNREDLSPWYQLKPGVTVTPEWSFESDTVKRF